MAPGSGWKSWASSERGVGPGSFYQEVRTGEPRPDVSAAVSHAGSNAGWSGLVGGNYGSTVCAYAINELQRGSNTTLGCRRLSSSRVTGDPVGHLDAAVHASGQRLLRLRGWAGDRDAEGPTTLKVIDHDFRCFQVCSAPGVAPDGLVLHHLATGRRPDVQAAVPGLGANTGFDVEIPVPTRRVCVNALNAGRTGNNNTTLGCVDLSASYAGPQAATADSPSGTVGLAFDNETGQLRASVRVSDRNATTPRR